MTVEPRSERVYRILTEVEYASLEAEGRFEGAELDRRHGFVHLSEADQVAGTLAAHFAGREGLVLVEIDAAALGDALVREPSRGGALFPHLYAALPASAVLRHWRLTLDSAGRHRLPPDLAPEGSGTGGAPS
ncbi:MAG: DUF952 domain-containing protein [Azospirillaceae bacterium]